MRAALCVPSGGAPDSDFSLAKELLFLFCSHMADDSLPPPDDAEIAALLAFAPVPRKCVRKDGWTPDNQRRFIRGVAGSGDANLAAHGVGRTARGAYELRRAAGAEGFAAAWDGAIALHQRRNPRRGPAPLPRPPAAAPEPAAGGGAEIDDAQWDRFLDGILVKYMMKLDRERESRLAGRIVEADFYVRQLTWLEVALDLGGKANELLMRLRRGGRHAGQIVATPMSLLLEECRRAIWARRGEPERPPPPALGEHDEEVSSGRPWWYSRERDGPEEEWRRRRTEDEQLAAEAQAAWEEKARKEAAEWRARVEGSGDGVESASGGTEAAEPDAKP